MMVRDEKGLCNVDVRQIVNVNDPEEVYPAGFRQWRVGEVIPEMDVILEDGVAYNGRFSYSLPKEILKF